MKSGWVTKKLGEVCEVVLGGTPRTSVSEYWGGSVPWLTPGDMGKIQGLYVNKTSRTLTPKGLENGSRLFPANSVILSTRAPIGYVLINSVPMCTNQGCKTIVPDSAIMPKFLAYNLIGRAIELNELGTGTTFKELATGVLKNIPIPIPPLAEQKRIVAKIDAAFEKIDKLKANAERNLANAKELFQSALDEAMRPKDGWVEKRLGEVGEYRKGLFGSSLTKRIFIPKNSTAIKVYEQKNAIRKTATIGEYYITREYFNSKMSGFEVLPGDIIVSCAGTIGETFIMPEDMERGIINQALMRMRIAPEVDKFYFLYYFDHILKRSANALSNGSAMKNIPPFSVFKQLLIPIPPLSEQREIVNRLDLLAEKIKTIEQNYTQQIADSVEMRQAVLREAFEGRL